MNKLVDLVGGDTGSDHLTGAKKDFGCRRTGAPHGGEFVGGAGERRDRRAGVAGDRIRGPGDVGGDSTGRAQQTWLYRRQRRRDVGGDSVLLFPLGHTSAYAVGGLELIAGSG